MLIIHKQLTGLMWASDWGYLLVIAYLIKQGGNKNITGGYLSDNGCEFNFGWTALHIACMGNKVAAAELLLRGGADHTICNNDVCNDLYPISII